MYADPTHIRRHRVKLALSDRDNELLDALCQITGEQKAALIRRLMLERARDVLHESNSLNSDSQLRGGL